MGGSDKRNKNHERCSTMLEFRMSVDILMEKRDLEPSREEKVILLIRKQEHSYLKNRRNAAKKRKKNCDN